MKTCTIVDIGALFTTTKKTGYIYTIEYYITVQKNEVYVIWKMIYITKWKKLYNIIYDSSY